MPTDLTGLLGFVALAMAACLALGFTAGRLSAVQKLLDARVLADINARFDARTSQEIIDHLTAPKQVRAPRVRVLAATVADTVVPVPVTPPARQRFALKPGEFPLLQSNPLVPLLTRPKVQQQARFSDRFFLITTRHGNFAGAAFLPA